MRRHGRLLWCLLPCLLLRFEKPLRRLLLGRLLSRWGVRGIGLRRQVGGGRRRRGRLGCFDAGPLRGCGPRRGSRLLTRGLHGSCWRSVLGRHVAARHLRGSAEPLVERLRAGLRCRIVIVGFRCRDYSPLPQQFLYFLPEPQGQGSLRPTLGVALTGSGRRWAAAPAPAAAARWAFSPGSPSLVALYWE